MNVQGLHQPRSQKSYPIGFAIKARRVLPSLFRGCLIAAICAALTPVARAQFGTVFTYQGQLREDGQPFDGEVVVVFELYAAPVDGDALAVYPAGPVSVENGLFAVDVDFGAGPFSQNQPLWLQVIINGEIMSPCQRLTAAPFSLATRGVTVLPDGLVGIGTSTPEQELHILAIPPAGTARLILETQGTNDSVLHLRAPQVGDVLFQADEQDSTFGRLRYSQSLDRMEFWTKGARRAAIDGNGNLSIGSENPSAKLTIKAAESDWHEGLRLVQYNTADYFDIANFGPRLAIGHNNSELVSITNAGFVGIGTANPTQTLEVVGQVKIRDAFGQAGTGALTYVDDTGYMYIGSESGSSIHGAGIQVAGSQDTLTGVPGGIRFNTTGVGPAMVIRGQSGNVGIGTTSPGQKLTVAGIIHSTSGGIRFPDGTTQTTAQLVGPAGPKGDKGDKGDPGPTGPVVTSVATCTKVNAPADSCNNCSSAFGFNQCSTVCGGSSKVVIAVASPSQCFVSSDTGFCNEFSSGCGTGAPDLCALCCVCKP